MTSPNNQEITRRTALIQGGTLAGLVLGGTATLGSASAGGNGKGKGHQKGCGRGHEKGKGKGHDKYDDGDGGPGNPAGRVAEDSNEDKGHGCNGGNDGGGPGGGNTDGGPGTGAGS